jgi:phenylacetate-CoA ligase
MSDTFTPLFRSLALLSYSFGGVDVAGRTRWLEESHGWSPLKRNAWRVERLNSILNFAWENVSFYKEYWGDHGVERRELKELSELERYPILPKDTFKANAARMKPPENVCPKHFMKSTGGSTGAPVKYSMDFEQWPMMQAFHNWGWGQAGYKLGDAAAILAGGSLIPKNVTMKGRLRSFVERKMFLFGVHMDSALARDYHQRLTKFGAEYLYGYPSVIYVFSKHLADEGLKLPKLRGVITTSEMLQPQYRTGIEKSLNCPVFDDVGCNDGGYQAYECSVHRGFHYNDLQAVLEVARQGEGPLGRLLITNLWNRSMPFVRYENGDMVELAPSNCPCGAPFPMIAKIQGRTCDFLKFRNGATFFVAPHIFGKLEIEGWQVVQTSLDKVEVRLCSQAKSLRPEDVDHVTQVFRHHLPSEVELAINHVRNMTLTPAGKHKPVWSEVKTESETVATTKS